MVRKASIEDIEILNNLKTKLSLSRLKYEKPSLDITDDIILDDNSITFISVYNNKEIGYLHGYKYKNKAVIEQIYVLDSYRDSGIGQELVNEFKNWANHNSLTNIEVNIENGNDAYFLFDKLGFEITKVIMNLNI